jgi:hypothetical protein
MPRQAPTAGADLPEDEYESVDCPACSEGPFYQSKDRPTARKISPSRDVRLPRLATGLMQEWIHGLSQPGRQ